MGRQGLIEQVCKHSGSISQNGVNPRPTKLVGFSLNQVVASLVWVGWLLGWLVGFLIG